MGWKGWVIAVPHGPVCPHPVFAVMEDPQIGCWQYFTLTGLCFPQQHPWLYQSIMLGANWRRFDSSESSANETEGLVLQQMRGGAGWQMGSGALEVRAAKVCQCQVISN